MICAPYRLRARQRGHCNAYRRTCARRLAGTQFYRRPAVQRHRCRCQPDRSPPDPHQQSAPAEQASYATPSEPGSCPLSRTFSRQPAPRPFERSRGETSVCFGCDIHTTRHICNFSVIAHVPRRDDRVIPDFWWQLTGIRQTPLGGRFSPMHIDAELDQPLRFYALRGSFRLGVLIIFSCHLGGQVGP